LHAVIAGETEIGEEDIDLLAFQHAHRAGDIFRDVSVVLVVKEPTQAIPRVLFVIDDEDGGLHEKRGATSPSSNSGANARCLNRVVATPRSRQRKRQFSRPQRNASSKVTHAATRWRSSAARAGSPFAKVVLLLRIEPQVEKRFAAARDIVDVFPIAFAHAEDIAAGYCHEVSARRARRIEEAVALPFAVRRQIEQVG
jgi:hypothetical protein